MFLHFGLYGELDEPIGTDYFCWLARRPGQTVLIDCGFNDGSGARRGRTMLCPPATALRRLGVEPAEVSLLILTHGHYDHVGNLAEFPAAQLIMAEREYEFWTGPLAAKPLFAASAESADIAALRRARQAGRLELLPAREPGAPPVRQPVAAGVDVIEVGGHTPGQLVVLVRTGGAEAVLASDALHYYDEMLLDRPFTHVADLPAMYAGFALLRELAAGEDRYLVAGHDPEVMNRFPAVTPGAAGLAVRIGPPSGGQALPRPNQ